MANGTNPIADEMQVLAEVVMDRRQAEMDLQRARLREVSEARAAPSKVAEQLQARRDKAAAREAKIQRAQAQGQTPPPAPPPQVEVTGTTGARDGAALLSGIVEAAGINRAVNGGAAVQQAARPGGAGPNVTTAAAGMPAGTMAGQQVLQGTGTVPAPIGPAAVGRAQPITRELSGFERGLSFIEGLLRAKQGDLSGFRRAVTGEQIIGFQNPLEVARETRIAAESEAQGLATLLQRANRATDDAERQKLARQYEERIIGIRERLGPRVAQAANARAGTEVLERQREQRLRLEAEERLRARQQITSEREDRQQRAAELRAQARRRTEAGEAEARLRERQEIGAERAEEIRQARPEVQNLIDEMAIQQKILRGEKLEKRERQFLDERRNITPFNAAMGEAFRGALAPTGPPATDEAISQIHSDLTKSLGREPSIQELDQAVRGAGLAVPQP